MKRIFGIIIIVAISFNLNGQDASYLKPYQLKKYAGIAAKSGDIYTAIDYYEAYYNERPGSTKVQHQLGNLYYRERNYEKAADFLRKSFKGNRNKYMLDQYLYAVCLKIMGDYEQSKQQFSIFLKYVNKDKYKLYEDLADNQLDFFDSIPKILDNTQNVIISHLDSSVNKPHIDFNPIPYGNDKLIYASLKEDELKHYDPINDELPIRQFYMAAYKNGKWNDLGSFNDAINGGGLNTGNGAFSFDGNRFYFTRCDKYTPTRVVCQLYRSVLMHNEWQEPELLGENINIPYFTSTMPSLGVSKRNTDVLYFTSDRPDGRGGLDIWYSVYDDRKGEFKKASNCGRKVNTIGNEITPYYNIETKTLYFSSDNLPGLGGYDVYKTLGGGRRFDEPINLGGSINSSYDELYYILTSSRQKGYFTSNRPGGYSIRHETCCDDIYEFVYSDFIVVAVTGQVYGITDSTFFKSIEADYKEDMQINFNNLQDKSSVIELLYDYPVALYVIEPVSGEEMFIRNDFTTSGSYFFNLETEREYVLKVQDFNRKEKTLEFNTFNITRSDTLVLDALIVNTIPNEPIIVKNVYYEFAMSNLTAEAKRTIDKTIFNIMKNYPTIVIEISSHTDSVSSDEFNMRLSQDRAQSVVDYLISKGIDRERLVPKGYGESQPIAPNSHPDGTDNPEGRAMNRRTEFRIIGSLNDDTEVIYED
jgi:outer membrane protein OmpA-like peptidoglycan-associated protein